MLGLNIVGRVRESVNNVATRVGTVADNIRANLIDERSMVDLNECSSDYIAQSAKTQVNLNVKATPSKDAVVTSALAVKRLWAMKRNEQGVWNKKLLCTIPHMFLYYFDNEMADAPRGVLDLYYYTDFEVEDGNVLILRAPGTTLSPFLFQIDDPGSLGELINSLHRDRYNIMRDERDAYQSMQQQISGEMHSATEQNLVTQQEKARIELEVEDANARAKLAEDYLGQALQSLGVGRLGKRAYYNIFNYGHFLDY
jgi:hypothetical protein